MNGWEERHGFMQHDVKGIGIFPMGGFIE